VGGAGGDESRQPHRDQRVARCAGRCRRAVCRGHIPLFCGPRHTAKLTEALGRRAGPRRRRRHRSGRYDDSKLALVAPVPVGPCSGLACYRSCRGTCGTDGQVTQIDVSDLPPWLIDFHLEAYGRTASKTRVPLDEAIVSAEARALAPAVDAGIAKPIEGTNAVPAYFVQTAKGGRQHLLAVDAQTGAFIANPDELYAAHKPVDLARRLASAE
jgi:hypothetical protein